MSRFLSGTHRSYGHDAGLEDAEIEMDTDDIIDFSGYEKGKEISQSIK